MVWNVHSYFEKEPDNLCPFLPLESVRQRTAEDCGVSEYAVTKVKTEKRAAGGNRLSSPPRKRSRLALKSTDVDNFTKDTVSRLIYELHSKRLHVTLDILQKELKNREIFEFSRSSLWRLSHKIGFEFSVDDPKRGLKEKEHIAVDRARFLRRYFKLKEEGWKFLFQDETWIFQRGSSRKTWHDKNIQSLPNKPLGEGKRYIVVHCGGEDGFLPTASLVFTATSKSSDYHDNMNADNYKKWFVEKVLPCLTSKTVFIMDNARYHSRLIEKNPTSSWTKGELQKYLEEKNIPHDKDMLKMELFQLAKQHASCVEKKYEIDELAKENGHEVLRLPPYHPELNAIELIWANCKEYYNKNIGSEGYSDGKVLEMSQKALGRIDAEYWKKCIKKAEENMMRWWDVIKIVDSHQQSVVIDVGNDSGESSNDENSEN